MLIKDQHVELRDDVKSLICEERLENVVESRSTVLEALDLPWVAHHAKHDLERVQVDKVIVDADDLSVGLLFETSCFAAKTSNVHHNHVVV